MPPQLKTKQNKLPDFFSNKLKEILAKHQTQFSTFLKIGQPVLILYVTILASSNHIYFSFLDTFAGKIEPPQSHVRILAEERIDEDEEMVRYLWTDNEVEQR